MSNNEAINSEDDFELSNSMALVGEILKRRKIQQEVKKLSDHLDDSQPIEVYQPIEQPQPELQAEEEPHKRKVKKNKPIDVTVLGDQADKLVLNIKETTDKNTKRVLKQKLKRLLAKLVNIGAMQDEDVVEILKAL